jgi:hypothetical protein
MQNALMLNLNLKSVKNVYGDSDREIGTGGGLL